MLSAAAADGGIVEGSWILKLAAGVVMNDTNSEEKHRRSATHVLYGVGSILSAATTRNTTVVVRSYLVLDRS